jgi:hypothetical protein
MLLIHFQLTSFGILFTTHLSLWYIWHYSNLVQPFYQDQTSIISSQSCKYIYLIFYANQIYVNFIIIDVNFLPFIFIVELYYLFHQISQFVVIIFSMNILSLFRKFIKKRINFIIVFFSNNNLIIFKISYKTWFLLYHALPSSAIFLPIVDILIQIVARGKIYLFICVFFIECFFHSFFPFIPLIKEIDKFDVENF